MRVTLLIPTLNELEGMKVVMPRVKREWVDEILVIDGGSTDGTAEYAREHGYRLIRQKSRGISRAYQEALPEATGEVVIAFSPDGNSIPELIPPLIAKMHEGYDMVIVSRYLDGAKSQDDDLLTAFGNWFFTKTINFLFGGNYTDTLVMFRAWRRDLVDPAAFPAHLPRAGIEPFLAIRCAKERRSVAEIPGDEPKRISGTERKMRPFLNGWHIVRLIVEERLAPRHPTAGRSTH